jgi:thiamine kinase-like enzyme
MHEEISIPELTDAIARLSALLGPRQGGVQPLDGGITNRNFRVILGGGDYVVRLPGKDTDLLGIDREAERLANRHAAQLGLAPKVAAALDSPACLVTCFVEGEEMTAEALREPEVVAEVARGLREFHDSGLELPTDFQVLDIARDYAEVARSHGGEPPPAFESSLERAGQVALAVRDDPEHAPVACHNDLLPANFLRGEDERIAVVDWEYAGMGDRFFDLGNLAVNNEFGEEDEERLLQAYFDAPPTRARWAALKLFRFMSDFREAMWGVVQSSVSDLVFDFDAYAAKHFARLSETGEDPRFDSWLEEVRGSSA